MSESAHFPVSFSAGGSDDVPAFVSGLKSQHCIDTVLPHVGKVTSLSLQDDWETGALVVTGWWVGFEVGWGFGTSRNKSDTLAASVGTWKDIITHSSPGSPARPFLAWFCLENRQHYTCYIRFLEWSAGGIDSGGTASPSL